MPRTSDDSGAVFPDTVIPPPKPAAPAPPPPQAPSEPPPSAPASTPSADPYDPKQLGVLGRLWYHQLLGQGETREEAFLDAQKLEQDGIAYPGAGDEPFVSPPPATPTVPPVEPGREPEAAALTVFRGIGIFTSTHPRQSLSHARLLDWVAIQAGVGSRADADAFAAVGVRVLVWEDAPSAGERAVELYNAEGWIGQAEGPGQLQAALGLGDGLSVPKALVTNLFMAKFPEDWVCIPEAYANANPNATVPNVVIQARNKGATAIAPVLGVYDASSEGGKRLAAVAYSSGLSTVGIGSFSIFLGETMTDDDWTWLENRTTAAPTPTATPTTPRVPLEPSTGSPFTEPGTIPPDIAPPGGLLGGTITPGTVAQAAKATGPTTAWQGLLRVFSRQVPTTAGKLRAAASAVHDSVR